MFEHDFGDASRSQYDRIAYGHNPLASVLDRLQIEWVLRFKTLRSLGLQLARARLGRVNLGRSAIGRNP